MDTALTQASEEVKARFAEAVELTQLRSRLTTLRVIRYLLRRGTSGVPPRRQLRWVVVVAQ